MSPVCFDAVDEVMNHAVADFITQLEVVHKNMTHGLSFQQLMKEQKQKSAVIQRHFYPQNIDLFLTDTKR